MSRLSFWLTGGKKFVSYFRSIFRDYSSFEKSYSVLPYSSVINYSAYLSNIYKNNFLKDISSLSPPKVPSPDGTFSFSEESSPADQNRQIIWLWEINKIPSIYRSGLVKISAKYSCVKKGGIFIPRDFSFDLAGKNDFFVLQKGNWISTAREIKNRLIGLGRRGEKIPVFTPRFTTKEKLILRLLFRQRDRYVSLEELSSYVYGRRMRKNLRATGFILFALRKKLEKYSEGKNILKNVRKFGYRIYADAFKK